MAARPSSVGVGTLLALCLPDWSTAGSTPAKPNDGAAARKAAHIANLSHELRSCGFANAVHGVHGFVLREL